MRRRQLQIFTMSFLDCITAGFGAVILLYMVMSAQSGVKQLRQNDEVAAEATRLEEQVLVGYKNLVILRNTLEKTQTDTARVSGRLTRVLADLERSRLEMSRYSGISLAQREHLDKLKADIRSLEEGNRRLAGGTTEKAPPGESLRGFKGTGQRQYLTGIKITGKRILVLVDASASMLDETLVNIVRIRNLPDSQKRLAPKWRRALSTVEWLVAQVPQQAQFQVYTFNTVPRVAYEGSAGQWLSAADPRPLNAAMQALRGIVPNDGTSLINAFNVARTLDPLPDQIILVTDGLPTQGPTPPLVRKSVDAEQRSKLFDQARSALPAKVPVSVILLPMEGDLPAPSRYWRLARETGGVFLMPSRDWP